MEFNPSAKAIAPSYYMLLSLKEILNDNDNNKICLNSITQG